MDIPGSWMARRTPSSCGGGRDTGSARGLRSPLQRWGERGEGGGSCNVFMGLSAVGARGKAGCWLVGWLLAWSVARLLREVLGGSRQGVQAGCLSGSGQERDPVTGGIERDPVTWHQEDSRSRAQRR